IKKQKIRLPKEHNIICEIRGKFLSTTLKRGTIGKWQCKQGLYIGFVPSEVILIGGQKMAV
ncbi:MAG: hypothetical protein OES12_12600, partial [Anaerolineae bacterium]|nr:hypothetical protein [Anaerolineae bacterium]